MQGMEGDGATRGMHTFLLPEITYKLLLNKCSGIPALPWERHSIVPTPVCKQLSVKGKGGLLGTESGGGRESVSEMYCLGLHFGENMYINAPSAEKIHQRCAVVQ